MKRKWYGPRGKFFIFLMIFCLIVPLADGIHSVAGGQEYADSSDIAPADSSAEIPDEKRYLGNYEVTADEDGNVYIDGMLVNDGDIIDGRVRISVKDVDDEENAEGCDEPFTLNIPFVDTETVVTFLPTDEGLEAQRQILYGTGDMTRDSDTPVLPDDGRVELTIQIAPGKKEQPEVPLKFGLEVRNGMYADLLVWDSELQEFSDMLRVYDVIPESEKSVALTLLIPPELSERLKGTIGSSQTFKIVSWMEDAPDAKVEVTELMVVDLPERFTDVTDEDDETSRDSSRQQCSMGSKKDECKTFGNKVFGIDICVASEADLNCRGEYSKKIISGVNEKTGVNIFGIKFPAFSETTSFSSYSYIHDEYGYQTSGGSSSCSCNCKPGECEPSCQCDPDCKDPSFCACNLSENSCDVGCDCDLDCSKTIKQEFNTAVKSLGKQLWSYARTGSASAGFKKSFTQKIKASYLVVIFIIPVELEAGAYGELGLQFNFGAEHYTHFYAKAGPFVDVGAFASAKVSVIVAWAGIKGTLSLIKDEFWGEVSGGMEVRNGGRDLLVDLGLRVWNDLYGPSGRLAVFAGYWCPGICEKEICTEDLGLVGDIIDEIVCWLGDCDEICIKLLYPCVKKKEKDWTLADWHSFHVEGVILDWNESKIIRLSN